MLEEVGDLTFTLDSRELNKARATQRKRTIPDSKGHFTVKATLRCESLLGFGLNLLELIRGKVTLWEDIRKFRQEHRLIHHPGF
jgi:hypothetical protein